MALIREFFRVHIAHSRVHGYVDCGWTTFVHNGTAYLQLDTYGSGDRQEPGKMSQSIQLDESAAAELIGIVRRVFPSLAAS